jgi:twitching motility two-component system response regulator PilH
MAKITIIDDDVELATNMATLLRKEGHTVVTLHNPDEAVRTVTDNKPDIVILDVMFPDNPVAGFDVARRIHRTRTLKDLPIILLTGVNKDFPANFSRDDIDPNWMPVQEFLEKPVHIPTLLAVIARLLK